MAMARALGAALRNLGRAPAFTGLIVLTLALGIGAATAMFSVVDTVLINALPFPNADRLGEVGTVSEKDARVALSRATTATLHALRRETSLFTAVEAYAFGTVNVTGAGEPQIVAAPRVTPGLLTMVGVQPALGRLFTDEDPADRVAILSDTFWSAHYGGDPGIIGREIILDDEPYRVIGVMPRTFRFPEANVRVWLPLDAAPAKPARASVIVLRRPELSTAAVNERLKAIAAEHRATGVAGPAESLSIDLLLQQRFGRQSGQALYTLFGAVWLVLLVACANVMNLMLVRASSRTGELAVLTALGASAKTLVRGVLLESVTLAAAGCAAGLAVAHILLRLILDAAPPNLTFLSSALAELDWRAWGFAVAIAVMTCVIFGLLPAWRASRIDAIEVLKQRTSRMSAADDWWQGALVAAQLSLVLVLLAGSGLLLRSFDRLIRVDPGFAVDELAVLEVQLPSHRYSAPGAEMAFMRDVEQRVEARAGVPAAISGGAPPSGGGFSFNLTPEADGVGRVDFTNVTLPFGTVSPDYFETMGIPIVAGRSFTAEDGPDVVVVNDVMARRVWGDVSPVGRRIRLSEKRPWVTITGVAADVKQMGPSDPMGDGMEFYQPLSATARNSFYALVVRSAGDRDRLLQLARQAVWEVDPKLPIVETATMEARIGEAIARPRFYLALSSAFALTGVLLAAIGVYGVSAYWVSRRRRELAIRMALGASREALIRMVVGRSLRLAAVGALAGLAVAIAGARAIEAMLFQIDSRDPATLVIVTTVLVALVIVGCIFPAFKAARVDPMTTLRAE